MQNSKVQKTKLPGKKDIKEKKDVKIKVKKSVIRKKTGHERSIFKGMNSFKIHEIIF